MVKPPVSQPFLYLAAALCFSLPCPPASGEEAPAPLDIYQSLKKMSLDDLLETETSLDDTFDIFDSLIKGRKVKVATGDEQSVSRAPAVTSVITAQDIEAMGAADLDEVLESVPGLHVARNQFYYNPVYTIRGMYSTFNPEVLLMINDIPVKHLDSGGRSMVWGGMPVRDIARIEVIRGPGSAVYGADAYSGVINIVTKRAEDIAGTETGARAGSFNGAEGWLLHGGSYNGWDIAASLQYFESDGHNESVAADDQSNFDRLTGTSASLAPGAMNLSRQGVDARLDVAKDKWRLRGGLQGRYAIGPGPSPSQALVPGSGMNDTRWNADLTWHDPSLTRYWDMEAQVSYLDTHLESAETRLLYPPGTARRRPDGSLTVFPNGIISNPGLAERHSRLEVSGFYSGWRKHLLRVGAGAHYADFYEVKSTTNNGTNPYTGKPIPPTSPPIDVSDTPYAPQQEGIRVNWHAFIQDSWAFAPSWELTGGLRYDHYSDFGSTLNPRLALVKQITPALTGKLLYGRAFRAPAFRELYIKSDIVAMGNEDLEPETLQSWELALDWRARENLNLAANLFYYDARDKILYLPDPGQPSNTAQNAGTQKGHGLELEARWKATAHLSLLANYAWQRSTDENREADVGNAPHHQIYLRGDWLVYPDWYLDTQLNRVGARARAYGDPRPALGGYATLDLTLRHKPKGAERWTFALGVRNLFDADAREPSPGPGADGRIRFPEDFPLAGRNWFAEVSYRF